MEQTWKVRGFYANWTLTLSAEASHDDVFSYLSDDVSGRFRDYFADVIALVECRQMIDEM